MMRFLAFFALLLFGVEGWKHENPEEDFFTNHHHRYSPEFVNGDAKSELGGDVDLFSTPPPDSCMGSQVHFIPRGPCQNQQLVVVSFPKSGRTWSRCIVGAMKMVTAQKENLGNLSLEVLDDIVDKMKIEFSHGKRHPYTHTPMTIAKMLEGEFFPNSPVLLLSRDPRDVAVSNYHDVTTRGTHVSFEEPYRSQVLEMDFSDFLRLPVGSFVTNVAMLNAFGSYRGGMCPRNIIYYENLKHEECWKREYQKLASLLQIKLSDGELVLVRERCDFYTLKQETSSSSSGLHRRWQSTVKGDSNSAKVRKGRVGGYVDEVSEEDIEYMQHQSNYLDPFHEYSI